jgi:hypothetical protein
MNPDFPEKLKYFRAHCGMYVMSGSYGEVCAFIDGMDFGSGGGNLSGFHSWLVARGVGRPELSWWLLALRDGNSVEQITNPAVFTRVQNSRAIEAMFDLLGEYVAHQSGDD